MNKGSYEYAGFHSRMSELELRLKQSEDERLALEDKFNKFLNARKSEEETQMYLLRNNYSQLLRQDKLRCDRNDMILQSLANVENRASMLTAKTDRLRLLRQHYESFVDRHYPGLRKANGRYRSFESLNSDQNENISQRSLSSSPRRLYSTSPSPFIRSPSITRRNSLVVSNSEIINHLSYKVPDKLKSHFSRRMLFEDTLKIEKDSKSSQERASSQPTTSLPLRNYEQENHFKNSIPTFTVSTTTDQFNLEQKHFLDGPSDTFLLSIPSYSTYSGHNSLESNNTLLNKASETSLHRSSPSLSNSISRDSSPVLGSTRTITPKLFSSKPLTKSKSFSYMTNTYSHFLHEKRQPMFLRRPSSLYQTATSLKTSNRIPTSMKSNLSTLHPYENTKSSFSENSLHRGRPSFIEVTKTPQRENINNPIMHRGVSPTSVRSKSPLTVVDDIFKKYLINYDKTYLSDPISESKYGKYLYPLSSGGHSYNNHSGRNNVSYHLGSKYSGVSQYLYDDIAIPHDKRNTSLHKTYGSQDSILSNDIQLKTRERTNFCFDEKKDWKEWRHYRCRYEYPPLLQSESFHKKSGFSDDTYNRSMDESNPYNRITEFTPHGYAADTQTEYSYTPNWSREDYDDYSPYGVKSNYSNNLPYEGKFTPKYNPASNENLKNPPQTPKKVSFSNEFLYNDKSDTDVSSNLDEVTTPFECFTNSEKESLLSEHFPKKVHGYQNHDEDISFLKESIPYHSSNGGKESEDSENKKQSSLEEKASLKNPMFGSNTEHFKYSEENENDKSISILENKSPTSKNNILKPTFENVEENSIEALDKTSIEDLASTKGSMHNHNTDTPLGLVPRNDMVPDTTIANEIHRDNGNERMPSIEKLGDNKKSSSELENENSKTTTSLLPSSLDVDFDHRKNVSPNNTGGVQSDMENTQSNIGQDSIQSLSSQNQKQKEGSLVNMQGRKVEELDELQAKSDVSYDGDNQVVQVQAFQEQKRAYDSHTPEQYQDPNTFIHQDTTKYPSNYDTEPNNKPENLYEKDQEGYVNKEYVEHEHGKEKYESEKKSTKSSNENQPLEYDEKNFRGSQQNIQNYSQNQYEDEMYTNPAKNAEHYLPVGSSENYVAEHEGEYPSEYTEQHLAPELQDSSRVPPNAPEQYKTDYNTEYQDEPQYGYNKVDATYDDQYEQGDPQYSQQQQPPYDQYQQEPGGLPYDQYDQQTTEDPYAQYQQPTAEGVYDQYEQKTAEAPYDQYEQQPAEIPYDQYEQQPPEAPYDQYKQQPAEVPYDQYEQQPAEVPYDQYEQQPSEVPYDQYEQQPAEVPYDQYEQQPSEVPYDQYKQPTADVPYEQYEQQPAQIPYDQYEQQPSEVPYDQYEQQPSEAPYDQYEQQPAEVSYDQYEQQPTEVPYDQYEQQPAEQYDNQYQGVGDQYDNYNYPYDQTSTVEQTYTGDQSQNYVEESQPYDYKEPLQQPYDEQEPYGANLPYEETKQIHPEQVYNTGTPDYVPKPDDSQYPTQQEELATPYTQEELSSREAREPTLTMNQILESDSESSAVQIPATQEDSSDFDFSNSQK